MPRAPPPRWMDGWMDGWISDLRLSSGVCFTKSHYPRQKYVVRRRCRTLKPVKNSQKPIENDPRPLKKLSTHSKKYTVLKSGRTEVLLDTQDRLSRLALAQAQAEGSPPPPGARINGACAREVQLLSGNSGTSAGSVPQLEQGRYRL